MSETRQKTCRRCGPSRHSDVLITGTQETSELEVITGKFYYTWDTPNDEAPPRCS